ncbi:hypothetical protein QUF79_24130 [Fictibacillus enclensis]|uniref:hypothetical protein n=1 Tax=Fictibacillus enclensis TaxID=1017270 RepID=UPI0025A1A750|nr:hypothetical protein [Fictibacillus enclensis]MDM5201117.1 hypothetical protein [Fictibacillus enclensis]
MGSLFSLSILQTILIYELPSVDAIRTYHQKQICLFWPEYLRKLNPQTYFVDLSEKVWQTKMDLLKSILTRTHLLSWS